MKDTDWSKSFVFGVLVVVSLLVGFEKLPFLWFGIPYPIYYLTAYLLILAVGKEK